jgi:hypothetical protein
MPTCWCTVTVTDPQGRRHSVDVLASSTFDAAHLYLTHARDHPDAGIPVPGKNTLFEVVTGGRIYRVKGEALRQWILRRRETLKGPKGMLFSQRPVIE